MKKSNTILTILLFVFFTAGVFFTVGSGNEAWGQDCVVEVTKLTKGNDIGFDFDFTQNGVIVQSDTLFNLQTTGRALGLGDVVTITETLPPGWRLEDVVCFNSGVSIVEIENGVIATCRERIIGEADCIFINVDPDAIPTLSEWGMISAAAGLGLVGMFFAIRRKRAAVNS